MSDGQLDIEFRFNTPDAKRELAEIAKGAKVVNDTAKEGNKPLKEQEGILERLKRRLTEIRQQREEANSVMSVAKLNKELQVYEKEIIRVTNAGKVGFDQYGNSIASQEGILQRLQRAAVLYQKGMQEATRPENIEKYSQKLALVNAEMNKLIKGSNIGGTGWNGLQNSINQIGRELPAITYGFQTFAVGISNNLPIFVDEIVKIRKENDLLSASGQKGVPIWKQLVGGIFSWQTALTIGITLLTVYGKEIGNFFGALFKGNGAIDESKRKLELLSGVRKEASQNAASEIATLKILNAVATDNARSMEERRRAAVKIQDLAKKYNQNISTEALLVGGLKNEYNKLTEAIIASAKSKAADNKIQENAKERLNIEFEIKALQEANAERKKAIELEGDKKSVIRRGSAMDDGAPMDIIIETVKERQLASDIYTNNEIKNAKQRLEVYDKEDQFLQQFIQVPKEITTQKDKDALIKAYEDILKISKEGLAKIKDLDAEYASQLLSSDEAEKQALRDKFADFRKIIEEENEKIIAYNKKNKKNVPLLNVDAINPIEQRASKQLDYTQNTARLQKQYDEEYKVFVDYQKLKEETNAEYADMRFADDLEKIKSFETRLNNEIASIDPKTTNALEKKRLEELLKLQKDNTKRVQEAEDKKYSDLLARMITYDQERKKLVEKQAEEMARAVSTGADTSALEARQREDLNKLDDANIEKLASVKELFAGIDKLTDVGARSLIDKIKALLSSDTNMSEEMRKKIEDALKSTTEALDDRLPERTLQIADGFAQMAQSLSPVNEGLATMLGGLSNVLRATVQVNDGISGLTKGIANYQDSKAKGGGGLLGSISAIAGVAGPVGQIVGAVSNVVGGVVSFFKTSKESARKAAQEIKAYQDSVLVGEYEYNRLLRERAREQQNINDLTNEQIELQEKLLNTQTSEAKSDYEALLRRLQKEGQQITGQKTEKYGGFLGIGKKTRVVDITSGLSGYNYSQLEELYTSNKLTDATKKLFEELKKAKEEIDDIADAWDDMQKELLDRMSGNATSNAIGNSIINGFKQGRRAVSDFADDAEEIIQNALLSAMNYTVLDEPLQELIKKFRDDAKDGLNQNEIDAFQQGYNAVVQQGLDAIKEIEKVTGKTIGSGSSSSSLSSSGIERITEQSATELMGVTRAQYDVSKQHLIVSQKSLDFDSRANDMLIQSLKHQAAIEANTAETVSQLKLVVGELKTVSKNTGGGRYVG